MHKLYGKIHEKLGNHDYIWEREGEVGGWGDGIGR